MKKKITWQQALKRIKSFQAFDMAEVISVSDILRVKSLMEKGKL